MGKKVLKLFLDTMLRAAVIILAVAIVVMLVLLAKTMSRNSKSDSSVTTTENTGIVTEEADPTDPTFGGDGSSGSSEEDSTDTTQSADTASDSTSARIVVINASGVSGVAASWQTTLNADGYSSVEIGNYMGETQSSTKIYVSGSYDGQDLVSKFSSASLGQTSELDSSLFDVAIGDFDIVVVIGIDNSGNN